MAPRALTTPGGLRRLALPRSAAVSAAAGGVPAIVDGQAVESVLEEWVVEDRWCTTAPLRRRYFELVLESGRNVVVFRDLESSGWFAQRA